MSALLATFGVKALAWAGGALLAVLGGLLALRSAKSSGAAQQRADDAQRGRDDDAKGAKARANVDGLNDAAVDDQLRGYQRK